MPHDIFLSYSRHDTDVMGRLRDDLRAAGLSVWTDEGIKPGSPSWKIDIEEAIRGARCLVVVFSPEANASRWVRAELDYAEAQRKPIFAVLANGDESNAVPFGYSSHQWIDLCNPNQYDVNFQRLTTTLTNNLGGQVGPLTPNDPPPQSPRPARPTLWVLVALLVLVAGVVITLLLISLTNAPTQAQITPTQVAAAASATVMLTSDDVLTIAPFTPPNDWKQHQTDLLEITAPVGWIPFGLDTEIYAAFARTIIPDFDPAQGIVQLPGSEVHFYLGSLLQLQGLFVFRDDPGISLPLPTLIARYYDLIEALGYGVIDSERVLLPGGEAIRIQIDTSTGVSEGIGYVYVMTHENQSFIFTFAAASVNMTNFLALTEQIMATLSFNSSAQ